MYVLTGSSVCSLFLADRTSIAVVIKTGLTPSASGSAYLELEPSRPSSNRDELLTDTPAGLKLSCTVHGPRPLPRSASFSPHLLLNTHVKFTPFAARKRRGYVRDASERDLSVHLETALRGVIIGERWPKSGLEIIITVLEGEEDSLLNKDGEPIGEGCSRTGGWGMMSILSGCITVASAALADAGIDCVDLVTGGVAAVVRQSSVRAPEPQGNHSSKKAETAETTQIILDPCPSEHQEIGASCVVAYLQSRDEITEIWAKGEALSPEISQGADLVRFNSLIDQATEAAKAARLVLIQAINESTELKIQAIH